MSFPDWNFVTYMANLGQHERNERRQNVNNGYGKDLAKADMRTEEEKVFTELRPAFHSHQNMNRETGPRDYKERPQFMFNCSGYRSVVGDPTGADRRCDGREVHRYNEREVRMKDDVIEQPLISWDLNQLNGAGLAKVSGDITKDTVHNNDRRINNVPDGEDRYHGDHAGYCEPAAKAYPCMNKHRCQKEEEFTFPQCIEEKFQEMVLRSRNRESCNNVNEIQNHNMQNQRNFMSYLCDSWHKRDQQRVGQMDYICHASNPNIEQCRGYVHGCRQGCKEHLANGMHNSAERNNPLDDEIEGHRTLHDTDTVVENIDALLTLINPDIDIMGKTFHKIPSTQPIYCDGEAREEETSEDNRIRRPMNAFMLWARKYRALVAKEFSDASNSEISVKLGEIWNELTSDQQRPYFRKAETLKAEHKQNHPNYVYQPRHPTAKVFKKNRETTKSETKEDDSQQFFASLPPDFGTPFAFFSNGQVPGLQQLDHVASTVVLSQDGTEVSLASHVEKEHQIMAPKPLYPFRKEENSAQESFEEESTASSHEDIDVERREKKTSNKKPSIKTEEENRPVAKDVILVKDAMMPRLEGNGDECDLVNSSFASVNIEDLDDFLAGGRNDLAAYFERRAGCSKSKDGSDRIPRKDISKKRKSSKKEKESSRKRVKHVEKKFKEF